MNKYQKALEKIENETTYIDDYETIPYTTACDFQEEIDVLQELVNKSIPKKPDYEADGYSDGELVYDTWLCPNCEARYEVDYDEYDYCPNCGQKILWEQEDENS